MKRAYLLPLLSVLAFSTTHAEGSAPEIVQASRVTVDGDSKLITMESDTGRYVLSCNLNANGCITPAPQRRYYLVTKMTRWKMPGAARPIDLQFVQDWTGSYRNGENIGLVPVNSGPPDSLGMFVLESWSKR